MVYHKKCKARSFIFASIICASSIIPVAHAASPTSVYIQELTWTEVQARIQNGASIAVVPTGATEQEGPHMVIGKHNSVVRYAAGEIAQKLGNALVAPTIPYAPSGRITPPEGHMQFAGTLSITPRAYSLVLADVARSLKQHGFRLICFIGDSEASQAAQKQVADLLSAQWVPDGVQVINVSDYFSANGQEEWNDAQGLKVVAPFAHAGHVDTSELMVVDASGVRDTLRSPRTDRDYKSTGAAGDSSLASTAFGRRYMSLKIEASVKQIQNASSRAK